jgi:putative ABC transport system ATP-binding protein
MKEIELLPLIKLSNASKVYQTGKDQVYAVKQISLSIEQNELVAIVGESGSGKSTILNLLGLLDLPSSGDYFLNTRNTTVYTDDELASLRNKQIGFVFQSFFLFPRLNVEQNVAMPLLFRNIPLHEASKSAQEILRKFHIDHLSGRKPHEMSGGQQQRVAIARALITDPLIILADEPTGSLDSRTGKEIMGLFIELYKKEQKTVVIVTHSKQIAEQCNRIIELKDGEVTQDRLIRSRAHNLG